MSTPTRYSFRNTPTRNEGEGAYGAFFKDKIRNAGNFNSDLKRALFNSTMSIDDCGSIKSVATSRGKRNDSDDCIILSDDDNATLMSTTSSKMSNKTINRLKNESGTPTANKKKSSIVRRNTISSSSHTPSMQKRLFSKINQNSLSLYENARIKLHVANTPDCLPCRDRQFSDIFNFIETNLKNQTGGCMYICGVPGTGKTLTTKQVISCLKESVSYKILPSFKFIDVNAFQVTEPHQIYKLIYKELTDQNVSAEHAVTLLEKKFEQKSSESIVMLIDELDMLCTKKQDVLYNIFDWPYKKNSKWIVIAIANAMNLPEQVMSKISSRLGLSRLIFQPYTYSELEEIVTLRLEELNVFDMDAITFAARKVAAVSGDARRALEICRRATELAEKENINSKKDKTSSQQNTLVSIGHVDSAIRSMFSSAKINALTHSSKMEQLFMKSISIIYQNSGIEETTLNKIYEQHNFLCRSQAIQPLNRTQFLNVCCSLASCKLILLEPSKNIYLQRVRCNMSCDDIDYVIKNSN